MKPDNEKTEKERDDFVNAKTKELRDGIEQDFIAQGESRDERQKSGIMTGLGNIISLNEKAKNKSGSSPEWRKYLKDPATIKVTDRDREIAMQIINRDPKLLREHILSDPDWRAWLENKPQGEQYEDEIVGFDGDFGDTVLAVIVDDKKFKCGQKVKLTLKLVEE